MKVVEVVEVVLLAAAAVVNVLIGPGSSKSGNSSRSGVVRRRSKTIRCQGPIAVAVAVIVYVLVSLDKSLDRTATWKTTGGRGVGAGGWALDLLNT